MSARRTDHWRANKSRKRQRRPKRTTILIVCEGKETERNYFDQMKREGWARDNLTTTVKRGKGGSREQIAQLAIDRAAEASEPFDEVWCVMDLETQAERAFCERALTNLKQNGIKPCLSNPAFEVWLLSHFQKTTGTYLDRVAVCRDLTPHWKSNFNRDYDKADARVFELLSPLTAVAIANARWAREEYHASRPILDCNSATEVYRLVERLLGRSK
jgi:hypothetical protein